MVFCLNIITDCLEWSGEQGAIDISIGEGILHI